MVFREVLPGEDSPSGLNRVHEVPRQLSPGQGQALGLGPCLDRPRQARPPNPVQVRQGPEAAEGDSRVLFQVLSQVVPRGESVSGQGDGRCSHRGQGQATMGPPQVHQAPGLSGHADRKSAQGRGAGHHIPVGILEHRSVGRSRRDLPEIKHLAEPRPVHHGKASPSQARAGRLNDPTSQRRSHGCIYRVSPLAQHHRPRLGSQGMVRHHHARCALPQRAPAERPRGER